MSAPKSAKFSPAAASVPPAPVPVMSYLYELARQGRSDELDQLLLDEALRRARVLTFRESRNRRGRGVSARARRGHAVRCTHKRLPVAQRP
jgi:hypothetical protein